MKKSQDLLVKGYVLSRSTEIRNAIAASKFRNARLIGSVARNEAHSDSDIDILVDVTEEASLLDAGRLQAEISEILDSEVDIVMSNTVPTEVLELISKDAVLI